MSSSQIARSIRTRKLGLLIYDARLAARRSIEECAGAIGIQADSFRDFEQGKSSPSLPELEILADYLEVPIEHFWGKTARSLKGPNRENLDAGTLLPPREQTLAAALLQARENSNHSLSEIVEQTGIPEERIIAFENGSARIPVPELEALVSALNFDVMDFMDQDGPIGSRRKQQATVESFLNLTPEEQAFIIQPNSRLFIEIAMHLSSLPAERLRKIAEGLLEITY